MSNLKSGKICIFGKELVHGFGQKFAFCLFSLFRINGPMKIFHDVPDRKLAFLDDQMLN